MRIALPKTGTAARIYYRDFSNPGLADEVRATVPSGGTYVDVGAHIGEYVLLAAKAAGPSGRIYALEPNAELAESVRRNAELNALGNVVVRPAAVGAHTSRIGFWSDDTSGGGWVAPSARAKRTVDCITLDQLAEEERLANIDVLKVDAAGGELDVIRGAERLMSENRLQCLISKLYRADVVRERFGQDNLALVEALLERGYVVEGLESGVRRAIRGVADAARVSAQSYGIVLVARKTP